VTRNKGAGTLCARPRADPLPSSSPNIGASTRSQVRGVWAARPGNSPNTGAPGFSLFFSPPGVCLSNFPRRLLFAPKYTSSHVGQDIRLGFIQPRRPARST
jgi:hypothetical protein